MRKRFGILALALPLSVGCGGSDNTPKDQGALNAMQQKQQAEVDDAEKAMQKEVKQKGAKK